MANTNTSKRITGTLTAATLAQRLAAMSDVQLAQTAEALAKRTDADQALTAVLERLEQRLAPETFAAFVAEIFGAEVA